MKKQTMKSLIFNWLFRKEIEEIWEFRQKNVLDKKQNIFLRNGTAKGIDLCMYKLGAKNTAYKYLGESI